MNEAKELIKKKIAEKQKEAIILLKRLVQEKSTSGQESKAQAIIIEKLRSMRMNIDIWEPSFSELKQHPYFVSPRTDFEGSPNVVGILPGSGGGKSLLLNGHIDVVPEGDCQQWDTSPYSGEVIDGKLYGRGSTDMKGGLVCNLLAIEAIIAAGISLKGDVIFQSVIEEESGGAGTLAAIVKGPVADGVIIPEPTNLKIFPKQQGSAWFRITVKGKSAHGGTRYEGISAIELSMGIIEKIKALELQRNQEITDPLYQHIPIPIPINIGTIQGGSWPSSVPDTVALEGRMGIAPHETVQEAKSIFEQCLYEINNQPPFTTYPIQVEWYGAKWEPSTLATDHPLMKVLEANYQYCLDQDPILEASPWGTDGGLFTQVAHVPVIVFGPGETKVAHYPNEYIELEKIYEAAFILACTILDWCEINS